MYNKKMSSIVRQDTFQYFLTTFIPLIEDHSQQNQDNFEKKNTIKNSSMLLDFELSYDTEQFFSKFQKCLILSKKMIINTLTTFTPLNELLNHKNLIQNLLDHLNSLCNDTKTVLQTGILQAYRFIVQTEENMANGFQGSKKIQQMFQKLSRVFQGLLHFSIVYMQYQRRKRPTVKNSEKNVSLSERIIELQPIKQLQKTDSAILDQNLLETIQKQISKQQIVDLIKSYIRWEQQKIESIKQICRICECRIKIDSIKQHVKYCTQKHKYLEKLQANTLQFRKLSQKIKQRQFQLTIQIKKKKKGVTFDGHGLNLSKFKTENKISSQSQIDDDSSNSLRQYFHLYKKISKYMSVFDRKQRISFVTTRQEKGQVRQIRQKLQQLGHLLKKQNILSQFNDMFKRRIQIQHKLKKIQCQYFKISDSQSRNTSIQSFNSSFVDGFKQKKQVKKSMFSKMDNGNSSVISDSESNLVSEVSIKARRAPQKKNSYYKEVQKEQQDSDFQRDWNSEKWIKNDQGKKVTFKDFRVLKFLGKGAFGKVYLVRRFLTNDNYAMKVVKINEDGLDQKKKIEDIRNQHDIFRKISGDFLVKAAFSFTQKNLHMFFLQYMKGGDFSQLLQNEVYLDQETAKFYIAEIVLAIEHLHKLNIIHRDLKPQNLVLDEKGHLKLTDFGLSKQGINKKIQKTQQGDRKRNQNQSFLQKPKMNKRKTLLQTNKQKIKILGTPDYIAPQIITRQSVDNATIDWWSLGVIIYEILVGQKPFGAQTVQKVFENIINFKIQWPSIGYEQGMMTPEAKNLIERLLDMDYHTRLGARGAWQIKNHPFFNNLNWNSIKNEQAPIKCTKTDIGVCINQENISLRKQIQQLMSGWENKGNHPNSKLNLDNLVRFDILSEQTLKSSQMTKQKKVQKLLIKQQQLAELSNAVQKMIQKQSLTIKNY